jgi:phage recombination protein Bet
MDAATTNLPATKQRLSEMMASDLGMDDQEFRNVIKHTVMPSPNVTNEHITAFLVLANQFGMNPFSDQIHAFPNKGGGVKLIVGYDGFVEVANRNHNYEGFELFEDFNDKDELVRVGCQIFRSDRKHNPVIWEYMDECKRNTDPWKQFPKRMLRNKAVMQAVRAAFGSASLIDKDEARDMGYDQDKKDFIDHDDVNVDKDLVERLETAAEETKKELDEENNQDETKVIAAEADNQVESSEENITKEVETKSGPVTIEVGLSPFEIVMDKIDNYKKKKDLEAYLKKGEVVIWPAQFKENDVKQLVQYAHDRLADL